MALISNLSSAATGNNAISRASQAAADSAKRLATGNRISNTSDDVAASAVGAQLLSELFGLRASLGNVNQGSSLLQVADGATSQIVDLLNRQKSLATQASSGALTDTDRGQLNQEFQALTAQIDAIAGNTNFNGVNLLDGSQAAGLNFQAGDGQSISVALPSAATASLFTGQSLDITTAATAQNAASAIDQALTAASSIQATIGASESRFNFAADGLNSAITAQESARSSLVDTDIAAESTNFASSLTQQQAAIAVAAQTKKLSSGFLKLLQ